MASGENRFQQDTQTPFEIIYPPTVNPSQSVKHRRSATRRSDVSEVNPRSELVTSAEGNSSFKGHHSLPRDAESQIQSLQEIDELSLSTNRSRQPVLPSTSRVRTGSDSSGSHSPRPASSPTPDEYEECVCNSVLDTKAPVFRSRSTPSLQDQSRESVRQELIADTAVRPSDPDQSPTNDNIAAAAASGGLQEPRLGSTYEERLQTFVNWENEFISPVVLAWAGFIFTGPGDTVACVGGCGGTLKDWRAGDNPLELHRLYFNGDCFPVDD